jgi:hypothetical protein
VLDVDRLVRSLRATAADIHAASASAPVPEAVKVQMSRDASDIERAADLLERPDAREPAATVADALAVLDRHRAAEDCGCTRCRSTVAAAAASFLCETCGYAGPPAAIGCQCLEMSCGGGDRRAFGCPHGSFRCPACDGGEAGVDPWAIVRDVRAALAAGGPAVASELAMRELRRRAAAAVGAFALDVALRADGPAANAKRWYGDPLAAALAACGGDPDEPDSPEALR